jgi:hypothetical protein
MIPFIVVSHLTMTDFVVIPGCPGTSWWGILFGSRGFERSLDVFLWRLLFSLPSLSTNYLLVTASFRLRPSEVLARLT